MNIHVEIVSILSKFERSTSSTSEFSGSASKSWHRWYDIFIFNFNRTLYSNFPWRNADILYLIAGKKLYILGWKEVPSFFARWSAISDLWSLARWHFALKKFYCCFWFGLFSCELQEVNKEKIRYILEFFFD